MADPFQIAGFEVVATLGQGARSTIYQVCDRDGGQFALKRVVRSGPNDQRYLDQAIGEHRVASQFDHPSLRKSLRLIKQRDFIRTSEVLVLMELVLGKTLEQEQPGTMLGMCRLIRDVALGLATMHELKFVHADIKPNNIMTTADGRIKIIDFGQSCPVGTVKPRIQGTPDYIAPEQVRRGPITPQTDIFNLGATMYWLLTNRFVPTLIPKKPTTITFRTENGFPAPAEVNEQVPPALSRLVMECVQSNPPERPRTMNAVIDRLNLAIAQLERQTRSNGDSQEAAPTREAI
ncbi:MAG: serine/threonine protein kinase [Phycisphaeraceae bacterium]|nr:serine/threonine protein kinase [Phycisphaeraceae bacterium]